MINFNDLNELATTIYDLNYKWWHNHITDERLDRNVGELLMLIVSELAEAMEGERKDLMDDKLPHRKMAEVEMADVVIRSLDFAGGMGLHLDRDLPYIGLPINSNDNRAEMLMAITYQVGQLYACYFSDSLEDPEVILSFIIVNCEDYCKAFGYDLWGAVEEKLEYNKHRKDHKIESRLAKGGKKF